MRFCWLSALSFVKRKALRYVFHFVLHLSTICYTMISRITRCWPPPPWPLYEWDEFPSLSSTNVSPLSAFSIAKLLSPCWWCWCRMLPLPPLPPPPPISAERLSKNFAYRFSPFAHAGESPGELFFKNDKWIAKKCELKRKIFKVNYLVRCVFVITIKLIKRICTNIPLPHLGSFLYRTFILQSGGMG